MNNITDTGDFDYNTVPFANLETVDLPVATSIGKSAFENTALTSVNLPVATSIGRAAFWNTALTSVNLPRALSIGEGAFGKTSLTSVNLPVATSIGFYAFESTALTSVNLPVATSIGSYAFNETRLTSVDLPAATSIGNSAFESTPLTSVDLPVATSIHEAAFRNVDSIEEVEVGMKAEDTLGTVKEVFSDSADSIKKLKVNNITDTGDFLTNTVPFANLETVDFPVATSIGKSAFQDTALTSVNLPAATSIGEAAFQDTALTSVELPKVTKISDNAFSGTALTSLDLPSLNETSKTAFSGSKLDYVFFPGNVANNVKASFDAAPTVVGVGIKTDDVVYNLNEGDKKTLTFNDVVLNGQEVAKKEMQLQGLFAKGEEEYKGNPLDYKFTANADSAGEYQGRIVLNDSKGTITETGVTRKFTVNVKEEVKAPKVNPVTDRDEVITGNGMKGAEVSAKVAGKEIGKGKVDEEGNFEIKIAKQKADTKISVTQTVDGETGPATEVVVSPAKSLVTHVFKKGYWEPYGLILNGQVKMDGLDLSKKDSVVKTLELVDESGKVAAAIPAVNTNWYTPGQYDGYQATLSAKTIAAVQSGAYKLQVSVVVGNGEATIVPITIDSRNMFGIQDYKDAFLDIPTNNIGLKTIETMSKDGQAMVKVTTPDKPIMGLISEGQSKDGRFVNGYVLNTDYDFSQKHQKNVVIEDKSGKVVKELKNIHTWDLTSWNLGIAGLDMKSGFQVVIPNEYQNTSLYKYKLQVVQGEEEAIQLEVELDKII